MINPASAQEAKLLLWLDVRIVIDKPMHFKKLVSQRNENEACRIEVKP